MGSPARRLTNPITRCWAHPNYGYAGTDDRQGTDQRLDTKRLTLMSGKDRYRGRRGQSLNQPITLFILTLLRQAPCQLAPVTSVRP
jgi:hypothetical protein